MQSNGNIQALTDIADQLAELLKRFQDGGNSGYFLRTEDQSRFKGIVTEAIAILNGSRLGSFATQIVFTVNSGSGGFYGGPSFACVNETEEVLRAAIRQGERLTNSPATIGPSASKPPFVDPMRIAELQRLSKHHACKWDFSKLARICGELNIAHAHDCFYSVAMLSRAVADHIPPVFGARSFAQVAANVTGKSMKDSMQHLESGLRKIADGYLHEHIREKETTPGPVQVDYRQQIDQLLAEVIRNGTPTV